MRLFVPLLVCSIALVAQDSRPQIERHEFVIHNFKTELGATLPEARIVYGTYGTLSAAKDNVILLPSHYMANSRGYEWLIGPGRALDTTKLFLVATELFGNGRSSSPSNTPEPFHGPRFPIMTIRDNVEAVRRLLAEDLKITHVHAIIGFSMGAQQAFQWAVSHPDFADRVVATSGTAKTYPHGIVRLEGQIAALTADAAFQNGDYTSPPKKGLEAFGMVWAAWLYSQEWWRRELWKQPGFNGNVERALKSIKVPLMYMPSETDLYFPIGDARYEQAFIPHVTFKPIPSLWGHTAGAASNPEDAKFLNENIARFLAEK